MYRILIVEDDTYIANELIRHLEKNGYDCYKIEDFESVIEPFQQIKPHLTIMDINLPAFDGYYWSRKIRLISTCPIVILSARITEMDQIYGIENGADDFIIKPFKLDVVLAKINGQIRRNYGEYAQNNASRILKVNNTILNANTVRLSTSWQEEPLTLRELQLCTILFETFPNAVTRQQLLSAIWDEEEFVEENTLSVNIKRLRTKLENIYSLLKIKTIRGIGYQLVEKSK